jgi:hypothetical protein
MRLRIVRPPPPSLEGFDLAHLKFGAAHDITPPLSDLLVAAGYGVPEDLPPAPVPDNQRPESVPTKVR